MTDPLEGTPYRSVVAAVPAPGGWLVAAEQISLGRAVTVRLLPREIHARHELADRLRLETRIVARLAHPNALEVTDSGATRGGLPFVVTDRFAGRSLAEELAARRILPADEAVSWATQALGGLSAAHASGIVHRDVRPDTLFLADPVHLLPRTLKVGWFGLSSLVAAAVPDALPADWARYLSPEQAMGADADERADLYAVGLVLYQMLVGADPFAERRVPIELMRAHMTEAPVPPSRRSSQLVRPELEAVILRALAKRPEERFSSAMEMGEALAKAMGPARPDLSALVRTELMPGTKASTSLGNPSLAELAREITKKAGERRSSAPASPQPVPTKRSAPAKLPETANMDEGMPLPPPRSSLPETANMDEGMPLPSRAAPPGGGLRGLVVVLSLLGTSAALTVALEIARRVLR